MKISNFNPENATIIGGATATAIYSLASNTYYAVASNVATSFGSNATSISANNAGGVAAFVSRSDHAHQGIATVTSSSSNTLDRPTLNLRPGNNIAFALSDSDGSGGFDTLTLISTASGGGGGTDWWDATDTLGSDETVTNSSTLTASSLTFPVSASDVVIRWDLVILYQGTSSGDFKWDLDGGGTVTFHAITRYKQSDDTANAAASGIVRDATVTSISDRTAGGTATAGLTRVIWADGFIMDPSDACTITLRFAQNSAQPGESAVLKAGSFLRYRVLA